MVQLATDREYVENELERQKNLQNLAAKDGLENQNPIQTPA
jgi:hypothetical protein